MSGIAENRIVLVVKEPVADETALASFDPSDLGCNAYGAMVLVGGKLWVYRPASVALALAGSVVVPTKIAASADYISDPATAPGRWIPEGGSQGGALAGQFMVTGSRPVDDAASDANEMAIGVLSVAATIVSAVVVPEGAVSGDNTNNATLLLRCRPPSASAFTLASLTLNVASGGLVAWTPKAFTLSGTLAIPVGSVLTIQKTVAGTGQALPRMLIVARLT